MNEMLFYIGMIGALICGGLAMYVLFHYQLTAEWKKRRKLKRRKLVHRPEDPLELPVQHAETLMMTQYMGQEGNL